MEPNNNTPLTADEIKNLYNFLFWKTNDSENSEQDIAQIGFVVWKFKKTVFGEGEVGAYYPPSFAAPSTPVPFLTKQLATKVNLDITLLCNGVQTITIKDLPLGEIPLKVGELMEIAIRQASGEIEESVSGITGYIEKKFSNQAEPSTYRVVQTGDYYTVHKAVIKDNTISWMKWKSNASKSKGIINQFKAQLANGSLQTEFINS